jgi:hypothetical protein
MEALALRHFFGVLAAVELPAVLFSRRFVRALLATALRHSKVKQAFEEGRSHFRRHGQRVPYTSKNMVALLGCVTGALLGCLVPRYRVSCQIERLLSKDRANSILRNEVGMR